MSSICVIGAGGSGLVAAKVLLADGHDVVVLERERELGGVWAPWRAFPGLTTQTPGAQFEFSDFAFPAGLPAWPPAADVHAYLSAYAERFGLRERIRCNSEVVGLEAASDGSWTVAVRRDGLIARERFDRVVLSCGIFDRPVLPAIDGRDAFEQAGGTVLHSAHCTDPALLESRRVVIVGIQKTATDLAVYAASHGCTVDMVYRRPRWKLPRRFLRTVDIADALFTRSFEAMSRLATSVPQPTRRQRLAHRVLGRPARIQFRFVELVLRVQFRLGRRGMVPTNGVEDEAHCGVTIETPGFYDGLRRGAITTHRTVIERLEPGVVVLAGGERIAADTVVYATGYRLELPFLADEVAARVFDADSCLRLYRNVLPPEVPSLAFVGFNSAIATHRTVIERLEPGVVVLAGGERIAADTVVYATGYRLELPFLADEVAARVFDAEGCLRLYRNVLPPEVPSLAFVGFNSAIASPLAAEVAAHWLAAYWSGRMRLPDAAAMHAHIAAELRWRMERWPESTRALRNACVGLQHHYMDALMCEMGRPPKVPGLRAAVRAMRPSDYAALLHRGGA